MTIEEYKTVFTTAMQGLAIDSQSDVQREQYLNMMLALEQLGFSDIIQNRDHHHSGNSPTPGQTIRNVFIMGVAAGKFLEHSRQTQRPSYNP